MLPWAAQVCPSHNPWSTIIDFGLELIWEKQMRSVINSLSVFFSFSWVDQYLSDFFVASCGADFCCSCCLCSCSNLNTHMHTYALAGLSCCKFILVEGLNQRLHMCLSSTHTRAMGIIILPFSPCFNPLLVKSENKQHRNVLVTHRNTFSKYFTFI